MSQRWIIEIVDQNRPAYVMDRKGELYVTLKRAEAATFATELDAKCARVHVADHHQPKIVCVNHG